MRRNLFEADHEAFREAVRAFFDREVVPHLADWEAAGTELKRLQGEWKSVGAVRKNKSDAIWERFRKACDHYFERYKDRVIDRAIAPQTQWKPGELEAAPPTPTRA